MKEASDLALLHLCTQRISPEPTAGSKPFPLSFKDFCLPIVWKIIQILIGYPHVFQRKAKHIPDSFRNKLNSIRGSSENPCTEIAEFRYAIKSVFCVFPTSEAS